MALLLQRLLFLVALLHMEQVCAQNIEWAQGFGGTQGDIAFGVAVDDSGASITVGSFNLTMDLDPGPGTANVSANGSADIFIRKVDATGVYQWGGRIGGSGMDEAQAVAVDDLGNVLVAGYFTGTADMDIGAGTDNRTATASDIFVLKLSPTGNLLWARTFGGSNNDRACAVGIDPSNNVITTGYFANTMDIDPGTGTQTVTSGGSNDIFVQKLDPNGVLLWAHAMGGTSADQGWDVETGTDGSVHCTGIFRNTVDLDPGAGASTHTSAGDADIFILKLTSSGVFSWAHRIGGTSLEEARSIAVDGMNSPFITGRITGTVDVDPGAGIVNLPGSFNEESFLLKLDASGSYAWHVLFAAFLNNGLGVEVDANNNVYATGSFGNSMDLDPGLGTQTITAVGASDAYAASYTSEGALRWGFPLGGSANDLGRAIDIGPFDEVFLAGDFRNVADMDPSAALLQVTAIGSNDAFLAKYTQPSACGNLVIQARMVIEGAYRSTAQLMVDSLRVNDLLPLNEPYSALGWSLTGPTSTVESTFDVTGVNAIVDWVVLELRDPQAPGTIVEARACLLQRDGDVRAVDGVSPVVFCSPAGPYFIAARHRNHQGVMTSLHQDLTSTPTVIDLTLSSTVTYGTNARVNVNGTYALWPGNVVPDNAVKYTGANNDRDPILTRVGSTTPNNVITGYWPEDVNLDGRVQYTGAGNDRDPILIVIGNATPNNTRSQQLP